MKKALTILMILCMLLSVISISSAETIGDTSATSGIDVVVVLDMSGSMGDNTSRDNKSDKYGYRFDATSMMIGMMDMDGSRIAIVPFAGKPGEPVNIIGLTDISTTASRTSLISQLYSSDFMDNTRPETNIGAALMKANQILIEREDTSNRPMIVLLTDGKNEIKNENRFITLPESLRWENDQIVVRTNEKYDDATADTVTREAYYCAQANHIPVYTVALGVEPTVVTTNNGVSLQEIAMGTGAECAQVREGAAAELPEWFARVLARQIGSSIQFSASPTHIEGTTYEVKIPILNQSVLETNIILPVKGGKKGSFSTIDASSIRVSDSSGALQSESNGVTLLRDLTRGHFVMVKIREPRVPGMWTLRFDSEQPPENISFNILYNYNIKFGANVTTPGGTQEFFKTDTLHIQAYFMDENETKVNDPALYQDHRGEEGYEDWMTIQCRWELYEVNADGAITGEARASGDLRSNTVQYQFEADVDLGAGLNIPSGQYAMVIYASGAGLERRIEVPIALKNNPPVAHNVQEKLYVNSTENGKEDTWTVEGTSGFLNKPLSEIVADADNDELSYDLRPEDGAQEIVVLSIEDGQIFCKTVQDGERIKSGTAKYKLYYNDNDGGTGYVDITVDVIALDVVLRDQYDLEVTPEDGQVYKKNEPLRVTVRLKAKTGLSYAEGDVIEPLKRKIKITNKDGTDLTDGAEMALDGDALVFDLPTTGNEATDLEIEVTVGPFDPVIRTVHVPNNNSPVASADETLVLNCDGEKVPAFLRMVIGENTPDDDPSRKVDTATLFSDDDGDTMVYSEPYFTLPGSDEKPEGTVIRAESIPDEDGKYDIRVSGESTGLFHYSAEYDMHITAKDGDNETGEYIRKIVIVDLYNKMMTFLLIAAIAIVALIILFLIVHQIRKPRFPKLNIIIREEPSLYESGSEELSPVKTSTDVNALGVDTEMAEKHGISMDLLQNIIVKPVRSRIAVGVTCKKAVSGHDVMLNDLRMKPKKMKEWMVGQELTIKAANGEGLIAIKLEDRPSDADDLEMSEFGGNEWEEVDQNVSIQGGKKHSRKAERKAPTVEETTSGGNDDFDF